MLLYVRNYVEACKACHVLKTVNTNPLGSLQQIMRQEFLEAWSLDHLGSFHQSKSDEKCLLVAVENLSRSAVAKPVKTTRAAGAARFLIEDIALTFSPLEIILSNSETAFAGKLLESNGKMLNSTKRSTTACHRRANSYPEAVNNFFGNKLPLYVNSKQYDWPEYTKYLAFAYNSSNHATTRIEPFFLMFGKRPTLLVKTTLKSGK